MQRDDLDQVLDRLVAEYSDELTQGRRPDREAFLARVPRAARAGLDRSLRMLEVGLAQAPPASAPLSPGATLDGFRLVREIGRGGMATVWLAEQEELRRPIALKLLRPALAIEQRHIDRFRREGLAVARLNHPGIVQIHAVGEALGYHYIAMEYVEGTTLGQALANLPDERPWTPRDLAEAAGIPALASLGDTYEQCVAALLAQVARALEAAHAIGIVHRDVKPSNILIRREGRAVVADFGLAKADADPAISLSGDTIGTPWYMSPEQAHTIEASVDRRTDVYSLGVTLYEAFAGRRPFEGETALAVLEAIKSAAPRALGANSPECSPQAEAVVRRAMARLPESRYGAAGELAEDLERLAQGQPTRARIEEGGPVRRFFTSFRTAAASAHATGELKSATTFLGLPLYHVYLGPRRRGGLRIAKGWFAVGDVAIGGLSMGGLALGLFSWGGGAVGLLAATGGLAVGTLVCGGLAAGLLSFGGVSLGYFAMGGVATGYYAIGGVARGTYAEGGAAYGQPIDWSEGGTFAGTIFESVSGWIGTLLGVSG